MASGTDTLEIQNVVASAPAGVELDLEAVADDVPNAEYRRDDFPGLVYTVEDSTAVSLLFRSGKIVTTGTHSRREASESIGEVLAELKSLGIDVGDPPVTVQNVVLTGDLGERLNLNAVTVGLGLENTEYEPEQFPGLTYRPNDTTVVVLLFATGKLVITGATTVPEAREAFETVRSRLAGLNLLGD